MTKDYNDLGVEFKYLIVNDKDQKYGLWVNTVGYQSIQPNTPYPLKDHPSGYYVNINLSILPKVEGYLLRRRLLKSRCAKGD